MLSATSWSPYLLSAPFTISSSPLERCEQDGGLVRNVVDSWETPADIASEEVAVDVPDVLPCLSSARVRRSPRRGRAQVGANANRPWRVQTRPETLAYLKLELAQM